MRVSTPILRMALCLALIMFSGVATAQLTKVEQKCVNTANKNAQKIGDAQAKDFAKGKNACACLCGIEAMISVIIVNYNGREHLQRCRTGSTMVDGHERSHLGSHRFAEVAYHGARLS